MLRRLLRGHGHSPQRIEVVAVWIFPPTREQFLLRGISSRLWFDALSSRELRPPHEINALDRVIALTGGAYLAAGIAVRSLQGGGVRECARSAARSRRAADLEPCRPSRKPSSARGSAGRRTPIRFPTERQQNSVSLRTIPPRLGQALRGRGHDLQRQQAHRPGEMWPRVPIDDGSWTTSIPDGKGKLSPNGARSHSPLGGEHVSGDCPL